MKITLEQEILDALALPPGMLSGYQIGRLIETRREREDRPTRLLFWNIGYFVGVGDLYRALDKLEKRGQVLRRRIDSDPPRFEYRLR